MYFGSWNHSAVSMIHYSDINLSAMVSQITGVLMVCSTVCSGTDQRNHQSSISLASHKGAARWKMFPSDDVIMSPPYPNFHGKPCLLWVPGRKLTVWSNNIPALVQVMDWRQIGDKPYLNQWWPSSTMHICATCPQWVNILTYWQPI